MRGRRLLRLDLPQAILLAVLLHLLLFVGQEIYPGILRPWEASALPEAPPEPAPLRFEFVDLPREPPEPEQAPENAPASDRTRLAASPRPREPLPESPDPFAEGNTSQKVDTLADLGADISKAPSPQPTPPAPQAAPDPVRGREEPADAEPVPEDAAGLRPASTPVVEEQRKAQAIRDAVRPPALRELGQRFDNVTAALSADFGTLSFETKGVDWGAYAKQIIEIIRANWIDRLPPAFYEGLRGRAELSFRIGRDGSVSDIVLLSGSGVRPFDKVAEYALQASDPLPPPPEAWLRLLKDKETVRVGFYYNLRPPDR